MPRLLACLLLLALAGPSPTVAQEPDVVWIIRYVEDLTLEQAVSETAALGGLEVEVEPALRKRKITLHLDAPVVGAIESLARAARAHLWKLGPKKYAVRSAPPPASNVPPREEIVGPEDDGEPPPRPEWEVKIQKALEETPYRGVFKKTPLPEFLAALSKQAGVPIHLDPHVLRTRKKKDLLVDFEDVLGDSSVDGALTIFCGFNDLGHHVRWGVVFVTSGDRFFGLPDDVFLTDPDEGTVGKLKDHRVTLKLRRATLEAAVKVLVKGSDAEVVVSPAAVKHVKRLRFTVEFRNRRLDDALSILLVPDGLALEVVEGKLTVVVRP